MHTYPDIKLLIDGEWRDAVSGKTIAVSDPATDEILGQRAIPTGELQIRRFGDISTAVMTRSYREARPGNRLLPVAGAGMLRDFHPHAPADPVTGRIMSVQDGLSAIGQYQVVTLNRGRRDGIERGHVLDVYAAGRGRRP